MSQKLRRYKDRINDYRASVYASVFLRNLIEEEWNLNYTFHFGGNIDGSRNDSPDFVLESENQENRDILGDLKKSICRKDLSDDATPSDLVKEHGEDKLLNEICGDLEKDADKYSDSFDHISDPHDLFFFYRNKYNRIPRVWNKVSELPEERQVAGISYEVTQGRQKSLQIDLDFGGFSNDKLNDKIEFSNTEFVYEKIPEIILEDEIVIVEENDSAPLGYLIFVLWTVVFDKLESKEKDELILDRFEREKTGEITEMKVDLEELIDLLNEEYKLPFFETHPSGGTRHQFSDKQVEEALDAMAAMDNLGVEKIDGERITYRIEYGVISKGKQDALETIIEYMQEEGIGQFESEDEGQTAVVQKGLSKFEGEK